MNVLAWNNKIGPWYYFVGLRTEVMINRDSWGYSYSIVRGEILGLLEDELLRKHLPRMFSLIKNESLGIEDDRYHRSLNHKPCRQGIGGVSLRLHQHLMRNHKFLGSGGSMVASLKLKEIDGRAPPGVELAA